MKIFYKETCGCCWHFTLPFHLFGFGVKDAQRYFIIFGFTIWKPLNLSKAMNKNLKIILRVQGITMVTCLSVALGVVLFTQYHVQFKDILLVHTSTFIATFIAMGIEKLIDIHF